MSKEEFLSPFKSLYRFFHRGSDPKLEVVDQWYNRLEYCELEDFDRAVNHAIDHNKYMPTPGELKVSCKNYKQSRQVRPPEYIPIDQIRPSSKFGKGALDNIIRFMNKEITYPETCKNLSWLATKHNADINIALTGDSETDHDNVRRYRKIREDYSG